MHTFSYQMLWIYCYCVSISPILDGNESAKWMPFAADLATIFISMKGYSICYQSIIRIIQSNITNKIVMFLIMKGNRIGTLYGAPESPHNSIFSPKVSIFLCIINNTCRRPNNQYQSRADCFSFHHLFAHSLDFRSILTVYFLPLPAATAFLASSRNTANSIICFFLLFDRFITAISCLITS